jgi:DAK2 domain fusion protein YloV
MSEYTTKEILNAIAAAGKALTERKEEVNRLNVFPVPDGDTGTNMSLTIQSVVDNIAKLQIGARAEDIEKAITTGALMGARGNSGVITSQILRGMCEGYGNSTSLNTKTLDDAFSRAVEVAFQAVRKPVEGTILTVIKDAAGAAKRAAKKKLDTDEALEAVVAEAYASVQRTPDLLPVLKENGVVDAGGFGLAILIDGFTASITGKAASDVDIMAMSRPAPKVAIEQIDDWDPDSAYRYCTEFLVHSDTVDVDAAKAFLPTMGDCDLMVGQHPNFKVHVHSNRPDQVLGWFLDHDSQISEVHVHNMGLQSEARTEKIEEEKKQEHKPLGVVAVASGQGNAKIFESLGVDVVVQGGQTMNPSTADLLAAVDRVNADSAVILPNNKNIIMAAQACSGVSEKPVGVVPTVSVPQGFSALFGLDASASLEDNVEAMTDACADTKTGEVTTAIKDSKDAHGNPIKTGDVIGIADGSIESVGTSVPDVVMELLDVMEADDADTATILAGEDFSDDDLNALVARIEEAYDELEVDPHRGGQALYPVIFSLE